MKPTKKEKAFAMAMLISNGYYDYFDKIEWQPKRHKFLYEYDCEFHTYLTQKELAKEFDKLNKEEQNMALIRMREVAL